MNDHRKYKLIQFKSYLVQLMFLKTYLNLSKIIHRNENLLFFLIDLRHSLK